jgi:anti-sigma factor RsiW
MNHPDDLFADYVDGTLPTEDREAVDAHLATCTRCDLEVRLADGARRALLSLPDEAPPDGLGTRAIREAERARTAVTGSPRWYRWAGAVAAAAAIGLVLVTLPRFSSPSQEAATELAPQASGPAGAASSSAKEASGIEVTDANYDADDLRGLVQGYARAAALGEAPAAAEAGDGSEYALATRLPDARSCLRSAYPPVRGELVRVIEAHFEGTAAYVGIFVENERADPRGDTALVVVAGRSDCSALDIKKARI